MAKRQPAEITQRDWLVRMDRTEPTTGAGRRMLDVLTADAKRPDPVR